jgi:hypothetical protein
MAAASAPSTPANPPIRLPTSRLLLAGVIAIAVSIVANLIIRWLGLLLIGDHPPFNPLLPASIIAFTTMFIGAATLIFWLINRSAANPPRAIRRAALIGFIVTLIPDIFLLFMAGQTTPMGTPTVAGVLCVLRHCAVGLPRLGATR